MSVTELNYSVKDSLGKAEKGTLVSKNVFLYDETGNMIEQQSNAVLSNQIPSTFRCKYDSKGNMIESEHYDEHGTAIFKSVSRYDHNGNILTSKMYDRGNLRVDYSRIEYKYDKYEKIEEQKSHNRNGLYERRATYLYDKQGNTIELKSYDENDKFIYKQVTAYDAQGNSTKVIGYDPDGSVASIYTTEYVFDKKGNWVIKRLYKAGKPSSYLEREITYYRE